MALTGFGGLTLPQTQSLVLKKSLKCSVQSLEEILVCSFRSIKLQPKSSRVDYVNGLVMGDGRRS